MPWCLALAASALSAPVASASTEPFEVTSVACPSTAQCTAGGSAVSSSGLSPYQFTFSPGSAAPISSGFQGTGLTVSRLSCPTATQCTGISGQSELTFDPTTGTVNAVGVKLLLTTGSAQGSPFLDSLSCPSATQCTAGVQPSGGEVTFDPTSGTLISSAVLLSTETGGVPVACPSTSQCSMVGGSRNGEVTFDPTMGPRQCRLHGAAGAAVRRVHHVGVLVGDAVHRGLQQWV